MNIIYNQNQFNNKVKEYGMKNLTFTEYTNIIDDDYKHIEFLSKGVTDDPFEKYICRLIYALDLDIVNKDEIIRRVNILINDKVLVTKVVDKFMDNVKEGFVRIGGSVNLMTSNGLVVTWNYRLSEAMLNSLGGIMLKIVSIAPDFNIAFKTLSDIREMHNEYLVSNLQLGIIVNLEIIKGMNKKYER